MTKNEQLKQLAAVDDALFIFEHSYEATNSEQLEFKKKSVKALKLERERLLNAEIHG